MSLHKKGGWNAMIKLLLKLLCLFFYKISLSVIFRFTKTAKTEEKRSGLMKTKYWRDRSLWGRFALNISFLVAIGIIGSFFFRPSGLRADDAKKVMTNSISAIGQYIWIEEKVGGTIMNQHVSEVYNFSGIRAGIEGSFMWSVSNWLSIHVRLGLTLDRLPKMTSSSCGLCSYVYEDCDEIGSATAVCDASFSFPMTLGIAPAFALAFNATKWMWIEAGIVHFIGLANGWEPDFALYPSIGVGFDFFHKKNIGLYLRFNMTMDLQADLPTGLSPLIALGVRF